MTTTFRYVLPATIVVNHVRLEMYVIVVRSAIVESAIIPLVYVVVWADFMIQGHKSAYRVLIPA